MLKKWIKDAAGKSSVIKSNIIVAACALLIACNVGVFIFTPRLLAPLALLISNAVTVILMVIAYMPVSHIMESVIGKKEEEIFQRKQAEKEMEEKINALESRNRELAGKLDTWGQMSSAPANINFSAKLETMLYQKNGYIVREEPLEALLKDPSFKPEDPKTFMEKYRKWVDDVSHSGEKTVLFIGKHYSSQTLGIDFSKVKYSFEGGKVALFGASITKIHNLETSPSESDIEHCWVLNNDMDKKKKVVSINTADHYAELPSLYAEQCRSHAREETDIEVQQLCAHYTALFRDCLSQHFPGIVFCDSIEDSTSSWYALNENSQDKRVAPIAAGMFLVANVLQSFNVAPRLG